MMQYTRTLDHFVFDAKTLEGEDFTVSTIGRGTNFGHRITAREAARLLYRYHGDTLPFYIMAAGYGPDEDWCALGHDDVSSELDYDDDGSRHYQLIDPDGWGPYELDPRRSSWAAQNAYINPEAFAIGVSPPRPGHSSHPTFTEREMVVMALNAQQDVPPADPGADLDAETEAALEALEVAVEHLVADHDDSECDVITNARSALLTLRGE